jgi:cytochrome c5
MFSQLFLAASLVLLNVVASCGESGEKLTVTPTATPTPTPAVANTQITWNNGANAIFATHCGTCHDFALDLTQLKAKQQVALARIKSTTNPMPPSSTPTWLADKNKAIEFLSMAELK